MAKGNMKSIKRRIKSVSSTLQITSAMEMVASSKLRRAKAKAAKLHPYFAALNELVADIAGGKTDFSTIFTTKREVKNRLFIVIAGDRGLAGGFNSNIWRKVAEFEKENPKTAENPTKVMAIGKRTVDYFKKHPREHELVAEFPGFSETATSENCADIAKTAADLFRAGEVDEVLIFYTAYKSAMLQEPESIKLLPFSPEPVQVSQTGEVSETKAKSTAPVVYDPSPEAVFDRIIPMIMTGSIHCACAESFASEQSARRNAMENASDNAEEMIEKLSLQYNRARQEKITNEINEIVGGANAIS